MGKDIFISHAWGEDELERDNHLRAKQIANMLIENNYSVWFDDYDMHGNIDNAIMKGINNAKIVILCLNKRYCDKVNNAVNNQFLNDNCYKEWSYCLFRQKKIIPIIMEPCMKQIYFEDGIIQLYLNNTIFIDYCLTIDINLILNSLQKNSIVPYKYMLNEKLSKNLLLKPIEKSLEAIEQISPKLNSHPKILPHDHITKKILVNNTIKSPKRRISFSCYPRSIVNI
jgi:hypothetical protein